MWTPPGVGGDTRGQRMDAKSDGGRKTVRAAERVPPLPRQAEARVVRRLAVLLGLVPLPEMTQAETDWLFHQKQRLAGDD